MDEELKARLQRIDDMLLELSVCCMRFNTVEEAHAWRAKYGLPAIDIQPPPEMRNRAARRQRH